MSLFRICRICGKEKEESSFRLNGKYRRAECHDCEIDLKKKRDALPEQRKKHAEYEKERRKREDVREKNRAYFKALCSSEAFKKKVRNDPRRRESQKKWRSKPSNKKKRAKYYRLKRRTDMRYRISNGFSRSVRRGLKNGKMNTPWRKMVGYSVEELMTHLESLFVAGMSWDNYGKWHIDHIVPVSSFSFSGFEDDGFRECWALSNLRPLWARDNLRKGSKISGFPDELADTGVERTRL